MYATQRERKQALLDKEIQLREAYNARKAHDIAMETIEQISREKETVTGLNHQLKQELKEQRQEAKDQTK